MGRKKTKQTKRLSHSLDDVRAHIAQHHPRCPGAIVDEIVVRIDGRRWSKPVKRAAQALCGMPPGDGADTLKSAPELSFLDPIA